MANAFAGVGGVNVIEQSGEFQGFQLVSSWKGDIYPSLPLLILQMEKGKSAIVEKNTVQVGDVTIPITADGIFKIDLSRPVDFFPFIRLLTS